MTISIINISSRKCLLVGEGMMDDLTKFKAWDKYVEDKPILKSMIGELSIAIMSLKENQDKMHERQEKIWSDISVILEKMSERGLFDNE